ncbi:Rdx family-domain-containing protein [Thelonectria olida]|uniref:Rdx family-domain-containing protein n=1 Tax=Thelonectria olida TaxID=1576542 RepID=A0A9P8WCM4_9HYPO|nr:Rdx family-domain-containing protein [Thelonectria olida]
MATTQAPAADCPLPRVTIQFCTQCKWLLRAAYYAQELLSTFSTALGEVALQPSTGGTFVVSITHALPSDSSALTTNVLWDRRTDGGFPETKELKRRVRDVVEPQRDLGHVDRDHGKPDEKKDEKKAEEQGGPKVVAETEKKECEDCK